MNSIAGFRELADGEGSVCTGCEMNVLRSTDCSMSASCNGNNAYPICYVARVQLHNFSRSMAYVIPITKFMFEKTYLRTNWASG